jgi:formylglycine-generating enzyme required for sulfatase activity
MEDREAPRVPFEVNMRSRGIVGALAMACLASRCGQPSDAQLAKEALARGMAPIPGGTFTMGLPLCSYEKWEIDPHPIRVATVRPFELEPVEVTVGAYARCVSAGRCSPPVQRDTYCTYGGSDPNVPINCVTWAQAETYCRGLGRRLPTEEEWEFAARGGTEGRTYPWGDEAPGNQLCSKDARGSVRWDACRVASYPPGAFGLFDVAGNVWEWTSSGESRPTGLTRVVRGGGRFTSKADDECGHVYRTADREVWAPETTSSEIGFRCAR